jgi:hypothetical protein
LLRNVAHGSWRLSRAAGLGLPPSPRCAVPEGTRVPLPQLPRIPRRNRALHPGLSCRRPANGTGVCAVPHCSEHIHSRQQRVDLRRPPWARFPSGAA